MLFVQVPATDRNALNSLWGKLASEILMQNWEAAMEDLTRLRETIDNNVMPHHSEFNTALRFRYIGHDIDCLTFQQNTITTTIAALSLSPPHALSFCHVLMSFFWFISLVCPLLCLHLKQNHSSTVVLTELDFNWNSRQGDVVRLACRKPFFSDLLNVCF